MKKYQELFKADNKYYKGKNFPIKTYVDRGIEYLNIEAAFDIETTSTRKKDGFPVAFTYMWMFGIGYGKNIYYGRTLEEFITFIEKVSEDLKLSDKRRLIVYVHNLGYEFQFIRNYFSWDDIFAVSSKKPIKATVKELGIEFRDSLILSGFSLANTAKNLVRYKVEKKEGDLDYELIRHQNTPLTEKEMGYCKNDIVVILAYIKEEMERHDNKITKLPLTNTGKVRNLVRSYCFGKVSKTTGKRDSGSRIRYENLVKEHLQLTPYHYQMSYNCFSGGFTHSNPVYTGDILKDVTSIDLTSSYPTVMLAEKFPMGKGQNHYDIYGLDEIWKINKTRCVMFKATFINLRNILGNESYISEHRAKKYRLIKPVVFNGRVFDAAELTINLTDVDMEIIAQVYEWDEIIIDDVVSFQRGYLPVPIIQSILDLYGKKTKLKGVEGYEDEYMNSKGMLNSIYGMCVTAQAKPDHIYVDGEWQCKPLSDEEFIEKIEAENAKRNRFLFYPWGVWVTAYARRNLWTAILQIGDDYIYSDTDSVKFLNYKNHLDYINGYNEEIQMKLERMMDVLGLDKSLLRPKTNEGIEKLLGVWEYEGTYEMFKTLGAKRYLTLKNGHYQLTVAGLNKKSAMDYLIKKYKTPKRIFNAFKDDLEIPADYSGNTTHTYIDSEDEFYAVDYLGQECLVNPRSSVHLEKSSFHLSIHATMLKYIEQAKKYSIYPTGISVE